MTDGLEFVIYTKDDEYRRQLSGLDASAVLVPNGISTAEFTLDDDDEALADIATPGARCAVRFRKQERFRGRINELPGSGPIGSVQVGVEGDMRKFWDIYGWPNPTAALNAQDVAYRNYSGRTETIFKTALQENLVTRLGFPWTIAPTLGRGSLVSASSPIAVRFHPLADKVLDPLTADELIVVLSYDEDTGAVTVDVRTAATVMGTLTVESAVADTFAFNTSAPTATRCIVGGRGEGELREFKQHIDAVREADWGDIIETFVDARNSDEGSDILPDAIAAVADGAPIAGIKVDVVETDRFRYGTTFVEGDFVNVRIGPVESREQITSVEISEDADDGVVVTPHIGSADVDSDPDVELAASVAALARGQRDQGRR